MRGPKTNDRRSPLPRRTGHGDFPHPALAKGRLFQKAFTAQSVPDGSDESLMTVAVTMKDENGSERK